MPSTSKVMDFSPTRRYVLSLWFGVATIHAGLLFLWGTSWMGPLTRDFESLAAWLIFDVFLLAGALHASRFRVRTDSETLQFLGWNFRWQNWAWDEVTRLERRSLRLMRVMGNRYRVSAGRHHFGFASVTLEDADTLAGIIAERADLDDLGEVEISFQDGTRHLWVHPSADE